MENTKKCNKCGMVLPIKEFYKHSINRDGIRNICKQCCVIKHPKWDIDDFIRDYEIKGHKKNLKRKIENGIPVKMCPKCQQWKGIENFSINPLSEFFRKTRLSDGLQQRCKNCSYIMNKEYCRRKAGGEVLSKVPIVLDGAKKCSDCHMD
jgi:hypothetical protein